jgi:hypothetical protein
MRVVHLSNEREHPLSIHPAAAHATPSTKPSPHPNAHGIAVGPPVFPHTKPSHNLNSTEIAC